MDGGDGDHQNAGNSNGGSRWNPTKEQISMLEGLYRQGLRTPTAEQIQQITDRLSAFGHIEGKNVFYWFQNHKARQRQKQKQKQESFACFTRFHHHQQHPAAPPLLLPTHQHVVCSSPCCISPGKKDHLGYYHQLPKVPLPAAAGFKRARIASESNETTNKQQPTSKRYNNLMQDPRSKADHEGHLSFISSTKYKNNHYHQTLDLFPTHPTGILQTRNGGAEDENKNKSTSAANTPTSSSENAHDCSNFGNAGVGNNGAGDERAAFFEFL